jgi:hypothetical protein
MRSNNDSTRSELDEAPIAYDRDESDPCQCGTIGCCIDHDGFRSAPCEAW